jgi:hypothetical protein
MVSATITGSNPQLIELIKHNNCQELKIMRRKNFNEMVHRDPLKNVDNLENFLIDGFCMYVFAFNVFS